MASSSNPTSNNSSGPTEKLGISGDRPAPPSHIKTGSPTSAKTEKEESFMASDLFCQRMGVMINKKDVQALLEKQAETLKKFEKTNAKFGRFNDLSATRYLHLNQQLKNHTKMLVDMKKDLDSVFRRIRTLKTKLTKQYGPAFHATSASIQKLEEELGASIENEDTASLSTLTESKEFNSQTKSKGLESKNTEQDQVIQQKTGEEINQCKADTSTNQGSDHSMENTTAQASEAKDNTSGSSNKSIKRTVETEAITGRDTCETVKTNDISKKEYICDTSQTAGTSEKTQRLDTGDTTETVDTSGRTQTVDMGDITERVDTSDSIQTLDIGDTTETVVTSDRTQTEDIGDMTEPVDTSDSAQTVDAGGTTETVDTPVGTQTVDISDITETVGTHVGTQIVDAGGTVETVDTNEGTQTVDAGGATETVDISDKTDTRCNTPQTSDTSG